MRKFVAVAAACSMLAACTTTKVKVAEIGSLKPAPGAQVLMLRPEVQLAVLTAGGVQEPRADWSQAARTNLAAEIEAQLKTHATGVKSVVADDVMEGKVGQLLRLNQAVGTSIVLFSYGPMKLPTKGKDFDWTLGEGAQALAQQQGADYALFVNARGTYASGGRVAAAIGLSLLGVAVPLGQQQVLASLVDLKTGRVVWFNVAVAGPNADMRDRAGAASLATSLLKDIPL